MCGISGIVDFDRQAMGVRFGDEDLALAAALRDGMRHRGPDGEGQWSAPGVILSQRRLAILDLAPTGAQPMVDADGSALTFNGEIYNYLELKAELQALGHSFRSTGDSEVLLRALRVYGPARTLPKLRGMFAFAYYEAATRALWLARDPIGKKPLYLWRSVGVGVEAARQGGGQLAFASSLWPLTGWLRAKGVRLDADPVAVEHHLVAGYIAAPRTIWRQVSKLEAGEALRIDAHSLRRLAPAPPPFATPGRRLGPATLDELERLLARAVERRLRSDVPVATFLSGGIDSSLVTALAARSHPGITAYTVRTGDGQEDELAIARLVARATGVRHEIIDVDAGGLDLLPQLARHHGEPFGDSSALPSWRIAERAGREHRVGLTGDGGDEVQGGYRRTQLFAVRHWLHDRAGIPALPVPAGAPASLLRAAAALERALPAGLARRLRPTGRLQASTFRAHRLLAAATTSLVAESEGVADLHAWFAAELQPTLQSEGFAALQARTFEGFLADNELDRCLALEFRLYLPEDLTMKMDVATMAHAVEARAPLLDVDFTDACWQIAARDRVTPRRTKQILRDLLARLLPPEARMKRKQGFSVPMQRWMSDPARLSALCAKLRSGLPGLPDFDGAMAAAELERRASVSGGAAGESARGAAVGELGYRLAFLAEWAEQQRGLTRPEAP